MKRICLPLAVACAMSLCVAAHANGFGLAVSPSARTVVSAPAAQGWHDGRYWDGQRYWSRDEWQARHVRATDGHNAYRFNYDAHCPPGHAKRHEC
ncbi:hypothetical protein [Paraburkholderia dilworthii]|uniref:hypothetical protein n=1 Tax=Paraburkholderia dilworthii TaxID=948106 RepID=UPI0004217404|nr:hypothetical protein [Paraburkholderia dilworthii]